MQRERFKTPFGATSNLKLITECAWMALLSRGFHFFMMRGKKEFLLLGIVAEWDMEASVIVFDVVIHNICGVEVSLLLGFYESSRLLGC